MAFSYALVLFDADEERDVVATSRVTLLGDDQQSKLNPSDWDFDEKVLIKWKDNRKYLGKILELSGKFQSCAKLTLNFHFVWSSLFSVG